MALGTGRGSTERIHTCPEPRARLQQAGPRGGDVVLLQTAPQGRIKNARPSSVLQITDLERFQHDEDAQWTCGTLKASSRPINNLTPPPQKKKNSERIRVINGAK